MLSAEQLRGAGKRSLNLGLRHAMPTCSECRVVLFRSRLKSGLESDNRDVLCHSEKPVQSIKKNSGPD